MDSSGRGTSGQHQSRYPQLAAWNYLRVPGHWQERPRRRHVQQHSQRDNQRFAFFIHSPSQLKDDQLKSKNKSNVND